MKKYLARSVGLILLVSLVVFSYQFMKRGGSKESETAIIMENQSSDSSMVASESPTLMAGSEPDDNEAAIEESNPDDLSTVASESPTLMADSEPVDNEAAIEESNLDDLSIVASEPPTLMAGSEPDDNETAIEESNPDDLSIVASEPPTLMIRSEPDVNETKTREEKAVVLKSTTNTKQLDHAADNKEEMSRDDIQRGANNWMFLTIMLMAFATLISVSISFYLYRWRRILISQPNILVPEEWGSSLKDVRSTVRKLINAFHDNTSRITSITTESSDKITNMTEIFMSLQGALNEKDMEISRLKKGYDSEIFRKFLFRFIRIEQYLDDCMKSENVDLDSLVQLKRLLEDAFDECGVEQFEPNVGDDYRRAEGIADHPKTTKTDKAENEFIIAEVLEAGYRLRGGEGYEYIVPAKVIIYTLE